jgi:flagellar basal body rod protein FlgG
MNTLEIAAVGLRQDLERLKLTSQNVANLSTPGYKRQVAVQRPFAETLALTADPASSMRRGNRSTSPCPTAASCCWSSQTAVRR